MADQKAHDLLRKHNITLDDVKERRTSDVPPHRSSTTGKVKLHAVKLISSSLKNPFST